MTIFVDSSGILALVDRDDPAHAGTVEAFALGRNEVLSTHAYVVVETLAVARRRYGPAIAADLIDRVIPVLAPAGTFTTIRVAVLLAMVAVLPLNLTDVRPVRRVPVIVTLVPIGPLVGLNFAIVGAAADTAAGASKPNVSRPTTMSPSRRRMSRPMSPGMGWLASLYSPITHAGARP